MENNNKKDFGKDKVEKVINELKEKKLFVSEAHLQTAFIIEAAKEYEKFSYYPEFVPNDISDEYLNRFGNRSAHFDLLIDTKKEKVLIEFKYTTKECDYRINENMSIHVKEHQAMDVRRYDCWRDISRIEYFKNEGKIDYGYFILITNVPALWNTKKTNAMYAQFCIGEGQQSSGAKNWINTRSAGTIAGREKEIIITNNYIFNYKSFNELGVKNGDFRYLIVEI